MPDSPKLLAYVVVLVFEPPGPITVGHWLAPDVASASVCAAMQAARTNGTDINFVSCIAAEMPADQLRHMLRAVEGKLPESGNAQVLSLVPAPWRGQMDTVRQEEVPSGAIDDDEVDNLKASLAWAESSAYDHGDTAGILARAFDYGEQFGPPAPRYTDPDWPHPPRTAA